MVLHLNMSHLRKKCRKILLYTSYCHVLQNGGRNPFRTKRRGYFAFDAIKNAAKCLSIFWKTPSIKEWVHERI